jgi:hypothetical protein
MFHDHALALTRTPPLEDQDYEQDQDQERAAPSQRRRLVSYASQRPQTARIGVSTAPSKRFTIDGSAALEAHLDGVCQRVHEGVRAIVPHRQLEAILLGGGYGRGEGGVLRTPGGDQPYNDLEFYVMIRGNALLGERRYTPALAELGHRLSPEAGLEVEFKVLTFPKLRQAGPSMFYYDLVSGHRWLLGHAPLLAGCEHHQDPTRIPLHEGTRLLMNRCSGLLFSAERLRRETFGPEEADFVGRNLAKAQLALGDAVLVAYHQYHWSCRTRHERLCEILAQPPEPWAEAVVQHHGAGVDFKLRPVLTAQSPEALAERHQSLTALALQFWLWLENRRLGTRFRSAAEYAADHINLCPETVAWKNLLLNGRTFGSRFASAHGAFRYPRERLFRALALLLWPEDETDRHTSEIQSLLATSATDLPSQVRAYQRLWQRYN